MKKIILGITLMFIGSHVYAARPAAVTAEQFITGLKEVMKPRPKLKSVVEGTGFNGVSLFSVTPTSRGSFNHSSWINGVSSGKATEKKVLQRLEQQAKAESRTVSALHFFSKGPHPWNTAETRQLLREAGFDEVVFRSMSKL